MDDNNTMLRQCPLGRPSYVSRRGMATSCASLAFAVLLLLSAMSPQVVSGLGISSTSSGVNNYSLWSITTTTTMTTPLLKHSRLTSSRRRRNTFSTTRPITTTQPSSSTSLFSSQPVHANLAVSLDRPLMGPDGMTNRFYQNTLGSHAAGATKNGNPKLVLTGVLRSLLAVILSDAFKAVATAFGLAFGLSIWMGRCNMGTAEGDFQLFSWQTYRAQMAYLFKLARGKVERMGDVLKTILSSPTERFKRKSSSSTGHGAGNGGPGVPMKIDTTTKWGVCTMGSSDGPKPIGKSSMVQYDFQLSTSNQYLPLALGQQLTLCCLDNNDKVTKANFYPLSSSNNRRTLGSFSLAVPNHSWEENETIMGADRANFIRVLKEDLKEGDEIAVQLGPQTLHYRGQYLPVTDMVYMASGPGIVPIVEQVRAVLPSGKSSVKAVSVVWINHNAHDFDVALDALEKEYFKYSKKLLVSCLVEPKWNGKKSEAPRMDQNDEINEAVPNFNPGTMAVLSGPRRFADKAKIYLISRGYPEDCICVLP